VIEQLSGLENCGWVCYQSFEILSDVVARKPAEHRALSGRPSQTLACELE
jgi:hypothetical protein